MKFGRSFHRFQVPEWVDSYVHYDTAKRLIKIACDRNFLHRSRESLSQLHELLSSDLDIVESFYVEHSSRLDQRLNDAGLDQSTENSNFSGVLKPDPASHQRSMANKFCEAIQLSNELEQLLWYGKVNSEAFSSLLRKLERLHQASSIHTWKGQPKLVSAIFMTQTKCLLNFRTVNDWIIKTQVELHSQPFPKSFSRNTSLINRRLLSHPNSNNSLGKIWADPAFMELFQAVSSGESSIFKNILYEILHGDNGISRRDSGNFQQALNNLLHFAIRKEQEEIVHLLVSHGADPAHCNSFGETALYVAARMGNVPIVRALIDSPVSRETKIDLAESQNGWAPLLVAAAEGLFEVARLLIDAGAESDFRDLRGWTAADQAAFRGHLNISKWLTALKKQQNPKNHEEAYMKLSSSTCVASCGPATTNRSQCTVTGNESRILVRLGPGNTRINKNAMELNFDPFTKAGLDHSEMCYAVQVEAADATGPAQVIPLPILKDQSNIPIVFHATDPSKAKLIFSLRRITNMATAEGDIIGSGVALLQNLKQGFATNFESLMRDFSVPILEKGTLELIATITFNFLLINPITPFPVPEKATKGMWESCGPIQVVGHRGSGMNTASRTNLQIGENTVLSFKTAAALGASAVEFDVQLTKDLVPVIYHDFTVIEQGGDTPLHALRAEQFTFLSKSQLPRGDLSSIAETRYIAQNRDRDQMNEPKRPRSRSVNVYDDQRSSDLHDRMRTTIEGSGKPIKGNVRGLAIQDTFPKFSELLTGVPKSVAFNVEMKYPMLWDAEDREMAPFSVEANVFVDRVLDTIYSLGGERNITFSSFSPEICILLAAKQQAYPILFLSKAGSIPVGDVRCAGVQQSIQFAKNWGLAGIVMLSDPLVMSPKLIQYTQSAGLVCCSYGDMNDEPHNALIQAKAGLDVIIVNKVRLIAETLAPRSM